MQEISPHLLDSFVGQWNVLSDEVFNDGAKQTSVQRKVMIPVFFGILYPVLYLEFPPKLMDLLRGNRCVSMSTNSSAPVKVRFNQPSICTAFVEKGIRVSMKNVESYSFQLGFGESVNVRLVVVEFELPCSQSFRADHPGLKLRTPSLPVLMHMLYEQC